MNAHSDSAGATWLDLPLIRVVPDYTSALEEPFDDVLGLYETGLISFHKNRKVEVPMEAGEAGGEEKLHAVKSRGRKRISRWEDIEEVVVSKPITRGSKLMGGRVTGREVRFRFSDGMIWPVFLPNREAEHLIAAVNARVPTKVREGVAPLPAIRLRPRHRWVIGVIGLFGVTFAALAGLFAILCIFEALVSCSRKFRERGGQSIFGSMAKLTVASLLFTVVCLGSLFLLLGFGGLPKADGPVLTGLGIAGIVSGFFFSVWLIGQFAATYATRIDATHETLPGPSKPKVHRWQKMLAPCISRLRKPSVSITLKVVGALAYLVATILLGLVETTAGQLSQQAARLLAIVAYIPATAFIYVGYRLGLRSADEVLQQDSRRPVVYLRSFADDGRNDLNPKGFLATTLGLHVIGVLRFLGPLANVNPVRLLRLCLSTNADTAEEQISQHFSKRGPFIAIGRPGEMLTPGGAARTYVSDDTWQERVREWLAKADTVLLQPAETEGVWWEIAEVLRTVPHQNVLFSLINYRNDQHRYEEFAARFQQTSGIELPRYIGNRCFFWLEERRPQFAAPIVRWPFAWPFSGCAIDFKTMLRRFFAQKQEEPAPTVLPKKSGLLFGGNAFAAVLFWFAVAALPGFAIHFALGWGLEARAQKRIVHQLTAQASQSGFVERGEGGYQWKLRQAWQERTTPSGETVFALGDAAVVFAGMNPLLAGEPTAETLEQRSRTAVKGLADALGGTPESVQRKIISLHGRPWVETVFEIKPKELGVPALSYIHRLTVDPLKSIFAIGWSEKSLAKSFEAQLREALDAVIPVETPLPAPSGDYTLKLDSTWKEMSPIGESRQAFKHGSDTLLVVIVEDVAGQKLKGRDYARRMIEQFQAGAPDLEVLSNEQSPPHGREAWLMAVRFSENGQKQFLSRLFVMEGTRIYQLSSFTTSEREERPAIENAFKTFRVKRP